MPDKFGKDALDAHNRYRSLHQAPQLKWSRALEKDAEKWAKQLAREGHLRHEDCDDGENVYSVTNKSDVTGGEVVDRWYSEVDKLVNSFFDYISLFCIILFFIAIV